MIRSSYRRTGALRASCSQTPRLAAQVFSRIVDHLIAAPWTIPNFSVDSHLGGLEELEHQVRDGHPLELTEGYYVIEARARP